MRREAFLLPGLSVSVSVSVQQTTDEPTNQWHLSKYILPHTYIFEDPQLDRAVVPF